MDIDDQIRAKKESLGGTSKSNAMNEFMDVARGVARLEAFGENFEEGFELGRAILAKTMCDLQEAGRLDDPIPFLVGCVKAVDIMLTIYERKNKRSRSATILVESVRESISELIKKSHSEEFVDWLEKDGN